MLNLLCLGCNYLGALDTPIDCAAVAYQGLDLKESLLILFVGLELFAGRTTELFLVAFLDIVPPNANLPGQLPQHVTQAASRDIPCHREDEITAAIPMFEQLASTKPLLARVADCVTV